YYQARFLILLDSNGTLSGIEQVVFDQLLAGEKKKVELAIFNNRSAITSVSVRPDINIFDAKSYIK
ncbi:MAG: hypothetical protein AAB666_03625, partial [Patescibacteria group bacterium]